jgi:hypothetical protein
MLLCILPLLLISNPYLSLCFAINGTGYNANRPRAARTVRCLPLSQWM